MTSNYTYLGPSGGLGGQHFSDGQPAGEFSSDDKRRIVQITIRSGSWIDSIQTTYKNMLNQSIQSVQHGGNGGIKEVFTLGSDEHVTRISGKYGWWIDSILIETNKGRVKGWGGSGGSKGFVYNAPSGSKIQGFFGHSGSFLDSIGIILKPL
jgi:hypothetical protein